MNETLIVHLAHIKTLLCMFEYKMAAQKSDVDLVVDEIERIRQEAIQSYISSDDTLQTISIWLSAWTAQASQLLADASLDGFQASLVFAQIRVPSYNAIIAKIDTYIYQQTKDLHTFLVE